MKKSISALLLTSLLASSLVGCGGSSDPAAEQAADKSEKTTLTLITAKDYLAKLQPYIDQYEADHPDVDIVAEESPNQDINSKINMAHASNADYDLMWVDGANISQFVGGGVLQPLDDYLADSDVDLDANFNPQIAQAAVVNDSTYCISVAPGTRVLAYNLNMLESLGASAPQTQEDILALSKAIYEKDGTYGFVRNFDNPNTCQYAEGMFWMSNGARVYTDNGDGSYTAVCDSPEMIASMEWWKQMTPYMPKDVNISLAEVREMFSQGRSMFYVFAPWEYSLLGDMVYGEDYTLMNVPGPESVASLGGWYLGMGAGSENKDIAWDFMETYYNDPEMQATCSLTLPGDVRAYDYAPFNEDRYAPFLATMDNCEVPVPTHANSAKVITAFFDAMNVALLSDADIATTMQEAATEIQGILDDK